MSESANLFLPNGIDVYKLTQYLKERYSNVDVQGQSGNPHFMNICFTDMTGAARNMSYYVYMNVPQGNDYPQKVIPNVSVNLSLGAKDTSNAILSAIAEAFGGGWLQKNDCGGYDDNDDEWIPIIAGTNAFGSSPSRQLVGVYNLIKADKKDKTLPVNYEESVIIDFVLRHLDEIKALPSA